MNMGRLFQAGGALSLIVVLGLCTAMLAMGVTQEVGIGAVQGTTLMAETSRPLGDATVIFRPSFPMPENLSGIKTVESKSDGSFKITNLPSGQYTVEAYTKAHTLEKATVFVPDGGTASMNLELTPNQPYIDLYASQHVFTPDEKADLQARGFAPEPSIEVSIYKVKFDAVVKAKGLGQVLSPMAYENPEINPDDSKQVERVQRLDWKIATRDGEGIFDERLKLPQLPEGLYFVRAKCGSKQKGTWLAISKIAMVTKNTGKESLAFVTDISTGKPIAGAQIAISKGDALVEEGRTDKDGLAKFTMEASDDRMVIVATSGESRALCSVYAYNDDSDSPTRIWTYTDRPVYRPGDLVQFKGLVRVLHGSSYALPSPGTAQIEVKDPNETVIQRLSLQVDASGTFNGKFQLDPNIVGPHSLVVKFNGTEQQRYVRVASYRKPDFKITVKPVKSFYERGETVRMKVHVEYYFGGPVPGAEVTGSVMRAALWPSFYPDEEDSTYDESDGEGGYSGEYVSDLQGTTDENGDCILDWDSATLNKDTKDEIAKEYETNDSLITFDVSVSESGDKYFDGKGSVKLTRGAYSLTSDVDQYMVSPGQTANVTFTSTKYLDDKPASGLTITVEYGMANWTRDKQEFIREGVQTLTTDQQGTAKMQVAPKRSGEFLIRAYVRDQAGNMIATEQYIYVWTQGSADFGGPEPSVQLILDKKQYKVGDQANAMIRTESPGGAALVTVESDSIYWSRVIPLSAAATNVELPIEAEYAPNAYLTVAFVKDKHFYEDSKRINVDLGARRLTVTVTPDRTVLKPREEVTYTIKTTTPDGKPVQANVSLGVVDEAIYAIKEDTDDPVKAFYPMRPHAVTTTYSFPELYLDGGDKSPVNMEVREKFEDTAAWLPNLQTGADGTVTAKVKLPDNLTSWRATATAITPDSAVGKGTANVRVHKELMVRLSAPAYFVQLDKVRVSALVTNDSGQAAPVDVKIVGEGIDIEQPGSQTLQSQPGKPLQVDWTVSTPNAGEATITVMASMANGPSDAMRLTIPIKTHGRPVVAYQTGDVQEAATIQLDRLPNSSDGQVQLSITPTLASAMVEAIPGLVDYPYGCTEQTMSRFMPAVIVGRALHDLGMPMPDLEKKIPSIVRMSIGRLTTLQHGDGGFGWWQNDKSEPYLTAYVLEGLWRAKQAGQSIDPFLATNALKWARENLATEKDKPVLTKEEWTKWAVQRWAASRIYLAYAVLLYGPSGDASAVLQRAQPKEMDPEPVALMLLAAIQQHDVARVASLRSALLAKAQVSGSVMNWTGTWGIESTARAFQALAAADPKDPALPKIIRYLMLARRGGGWFSTRDTAIALIGMTQYLMSTHELDANFALSVSLNGKPIKSLNVTRVTALSGEMNVQLPISELQEGTNAIEIRKTGPGLAYYTLESRQTPFQQDIGMLVNQSGLTVERTYHSLAAQKMEDGSLELRPSAKAETRFQSGQPVRCVLKLHADDDFEFVMIEVPTPANLHVNENTEPETWDWWWSDISVFDDRVVIFARNVPKGDQTIEFNLRAEAPGVAHGLPALMYEMYAPETRASSGEVAVEVMPK